MKVLIFMTQFYQLGGAERLAVELAEDLNQRGIPADILSMYAENLPGVPEAKALLLKKGIPAVHFLGMQVRPSAASTLLAIIKLRRFIQKQGYDVVETSLTSPTILASWATLGLPARHVAGLHQVFSPDRETNWQFQILRLSVRCNRRIRYYAISDHAAECWVKYSQSPASSTRRIYNGIPETSFTQISDKRRVCEEMGIPTDARLVLYVGRLAVKKGIDILLEAVGPLLAEYHLALLYVGSPDLSDDGTEEMLRKMKQRIADEKWGERVQFLGFRKDIPRLMASADLLAHPTWREGFGLSLVEALAAGLPIVASDVEAIPEILIDTGSILVPAGNSAKLREAVLKTLRRTPAEAAKVAEAGRARAENFRMKFRTDAMLHLFEDVLAGRF